MSEERDPVAAPADPGATASAPSAEPAAPIAASPVIETPAVEISAPAPEPEPEPAAAIAPLENLLSGAVDKPAAEVVPVADAIVPAVPAEAPGYEWQPFTLPEDLASPLDDARVGAFRDVLAAPDLSPQDRGQRLLDLHIAEMRAYDERALERQFETFGNMQRGWIEKFKGDPEIGGPAAQTHMQLANRAIQRLHSEEKRFGQALPAARNGEARESDHSAFMDMLRVTGAVNHPEMVRHLARIEKVLSEPARAAPALGPSAVPRDIGNRRASALPGNPGRGATRMRDMYDNERSQQVFNGGSR